ncbi:ABC transporter substrate-binding protein [Streptomyces sp. NPDC101151]|uniref:ABC transporter substrate-binding protein n=1 Tax=Streptomyces sp. NPDC101151 TaxID=3366115 RepID=UPI0038143EAB
MNRHLRICAVLVTLMLAAAGCGSSRPGGGADAVPGVTADTIMIGSHQPLTGLASPGGNELAPAARAYFDYVNSQGGVHGRKIFFKYVDDAYNRGNSLSVVRELVEQDKVFAILDGFGTGPHEAVADYLNARRVPDLFPVSGCPCWNDPIKRPYTFGWEPDYRREGKILGTYVAKAFAGKRIAYFYQDDDFGRSGVAGLDSVLPGASVVARESYKPRYNDITRQMRAIAQAKADVIVAFSVPADTALLRLEQQRMHNSARVVASYAGSDPTTLSALLAATGPQSAVTGRGSPLIQGIITDAFLPPAADTANSWTALMKQIHNRYLPNRPLNLYAQAGIATAYLFVQALQRAGKSPTRQSLVAALERGGLPGPGLTPLAYRRTSHAGLTGVQIGVIKGDAIVLQGQPLITDDGSGPVTPYRAPQTKAPANGIPAPDTPS